jgi:uncharacterized protein YkwD
VRKFLSRIAAAVALAALGSVPAAAQLKIDKRPPGDLTTPIKGPSAGESVPFPKGDLARRAAMTRENLARATSVVSLTKEFRAQEGKPSLKESAALNKVAQSYAALMAIKDQPGHNVDGKDGSRRLDEAGYAWSAMAENVGWNLGQKDPAAWMVQKWKDSKDGHRENLLSTAVTEIGVGVATSSTGKIYFCQLFAKPK